MKWIVDRIENNLVVLENSTTREIKEVELNLLPSSIHEGAILIKQENKYILDEEEEFKRRKEIEERFKRLRQQ